MSMFHELMMRKKEEIMYATIKGTLTENDGVFSGFSTSNYLKTQQVFSPQDKSWEMVFRFTINSVSGDQSIVSLAGNNAFSIFQNSSAIQVFISSNGTSWNIVNSIIFYATANTTYTVKIKFTGNEYIIYSLENNEWVVKETVSSSAQIYGGLPFAFGVARTYANPFSGSIDLNQSYIKIGATKYKLQAVVGYTIVGSPTITDGVASGFSSGNYLSLPQTKNTDITEICMKINIPSSALGLNKYTSCLTGAIQITVYSSTTKFTYANVNINGIGDIYFNVSGNISPDTDYWLKYVKKGAKCQTYWSTDGVNFTLGATKDNTITLVTNYLNIGGSGSRFFEGIIDLNETYIKSNNKLWFNGQQA